MNKGMKNKLIVKQAIKLQELRKELKFKRKVIKEAKLMLVAIGQPLNDNKLQFNKEQLKWAGELQHTLEQN